MAPRNDDTCQHRTNGVLCRRSAITTVGDVQMCKAHAALSGAVYTRTPEAGANPWGLRKRDANRMEALSVDPKLVDPRQLIAVQRLFLEQVISPSDDVVIRRAIPYARERLNDSQAGIDDVEQVDIEQVLDKVSHDALYHLDKHTQRGIDAYKVLKVEEALMNRVQPILTEIGQAVARVLESEIRDPDLLSRILQRLDVESSVIATKLRAAADEAKR